MGEITAPELYEHDFYSWTQQQSQVLRRAADERVNARSGDRLPDHRVHQAHVVERQIRVELGERRELGGLERDAQRLVARSVQGQHQLVRAGSCRFLQRVHYDLIATVGRRRAVIFPARRRLQQRVLGYFLGNDGFEFQIRQLQQADGLLQLRRQDECLRLPDIETWAECHCAKRLAAKD